MKPLAPSTPWPSPSAAAGTLMGADGALLAGLGYNPKDHRTSAKNVAEQAKSNRFLPLFHLP